MYLTVKNKETGAIRTITQKSLSLLDKKQRAKYEIVNPTEKQAASPNEQPQAAPAKSAVPAAKGKPGPKPKKQISSPQGAEVE